ncbi:MAG: 5'-nucleotidase, lipoprotein e(P4) family [Thermoanaerobaculia bacterium]
MRKLALALAFVSFACTTTQPHTAAAPPCNSGQTLLNATLWMQQSAEYRANALQAYATATRMLDAALTQPPASSLPPAIVLDLDETSLDNMDFESDVIRQGKTYDQKVWDEWIAKETARGVPGAKEFLLYAASRGVTPFYITNRRTPEKEHTRAILIKLGYPMSGSEDTLIVRGDADPKDKTGRRNTVAASHRILLLLGDDLNDFTDAATMTPDQRAKIVADAASNWGTKWIILPNPVYGSWIDTLLAGANETDDCTKKLNKLR